MAFKARSKSRGRPFARKRRASRYELAQFSVCNRDLLLGLSDCRSLDQHFFPIVVAREWLAPTVRVAATGLTVLDAIEPHAGKGVTVRGIQFDYCLSHRPELSDSESGVGERGATVYARCGLVKMRIAPNGALAEFNETVPMNPPQNILHYAGTMRYNTADGAATGLGGEEEVRTQLRTMWRSLQVIDCTNDLSISAPTVQQVQEIQIISLIANMDTMKYRHARVRTACRLNHDEALFFVVESFNSGLTFSPTLQFNMVGTCAIKTNFGGRKIYDTQALSFAAP